MKNRKVFISYSHDSDLHKNNVLELSERLRKDGIETILDRYVEGTPEQGWPRWILDGLDSADFVLVVCSEIYYRRFRGHEEVGRGKGASWEGALITQKLYDDSGHISKFIPIFLSDYENRFIPEPLRSATFYALKESGRYQHLYDFLLGQSGVQPFPVGAPNIKTRSIGAAMSFENFKRPKIKKIDIDRIVRCAPDELIGRDVEVNRLFDAWGRAERGESKRPHILTFVALGGEGKTSLVAKWVAELAYQGWPGCDVAFAWSFYSQGTRDQVAASSDLFLAEALSFFGDVETAGSPRSVFDKGKRLAQVVGEQRALLILDGLESLQHGPAGPTPGEIKDQGIAVLLRGLAARNLGLCLLTTRYSVPDLRTYWQTTAPEEKLDRLSQNAGVSLLEKLGVKGKRKELAELVEDVKGHALSLNLFGSYLCDAHAGDIRKRELVKFEDADNEQQRGHCFRVIDAYVRWFKEGGQKGEQALSMLRLVGLFDRPAAANCVDELLSEPVVLGLNEALIDMDGTTLNILLSRLERAKLIAVLRDSAGSLFALDMHPFLREYFGRLFQSEYPDAWRAGHERLYEFLREITSDAVNPSIVDLQALYQAIPHACFAGKQEDACRKVYLKHIKRGDENYSANMLGAFSSDLAAVACFFDVPWSEPSRALTQFSRSWLLNEASLCLQALGRLTEARKPLQIALNVHVEQGAWRRAAVIANNLSELERGLGNLRQSVESANDSVIYANRDGKNIHTRIINLASLADALHMEGRIDDANSIFSESECLQEKIQGDIQFLISISGFYYHDFILSSAERSAWRAVIGPSAGADPLILVATCEKVHLRIVRTVEALAHYETPLLEDPLLLMAMHRAGFCAAIAKQLPLDALHPFTQEIVEGFRRAGQLKFLSLGLLASAWLRGLSGKRIGSNSAQGDLDEAWEIAERGPMPLLMADIHLYRARLFGSPHLKVEAEQYPWQSPLVDLAEARRLIEKHGYWRRREELEDAEVAARHW